jgi:hypothetical protein
MLSRHPVALLGDVPVAADFARLVASRRRPRYAPAFSKRLTLSKAETTDNAVMAPTARCRHEQTGPENSKFRRSNEWEPRIDDPQITVLSDFSSLRRGSRLGKTDCAGNKHVGIGRQIRAT